MAQNKVGTQGSETQGSEVERLAKVAKALDTIASYACLFVGLRAKKRVAWISAMKTLMFEYENGKVERVSPRLVRRFTICIHEPKDLAKVAEALDFLAKHAYLYGGPRRRPRRIVAVTAEKTLRINYEDGGYQYIMPQQRRYFIVYITKDA
jgi:hypothetical protein